MSEVQDFRALTQERVIHQYQSSPKFMGLVLGIAELLASARDAICSTETLYLIDEAEGVNLDAIGEILGQPRDLANVVTLRYFTLRDEGAAEDVSLGTVDESDPTTGARLRSENESGSVSERLADPEYRLLLRAKVVRNSTRATPEDQIRNIQAVLGDGAAVHMTRPAPLEWLATVQRPISSVESEILNAEDGIRGEIPVIPRAIGTRLSVVGI